MYISTPCPKCKKQVCIDLTITEKLTPATAESTLEQGNIEGIVEYVWAAIAYGKMYKIDFAKMYVV